MSSSRPLESALLINNFKNKLVALYYREKARLYYRLIFGNMGRKSRIIKPILINHPECIFIGNNVTIRHGARIEAVCSYAGVSFRPVIEIGDGTSIEQGFHVTCAERVVIGKKVAITEYVGIFDIWHSFEDPSTPVVEQPLKTAPVEIGDDCLIGMGVVIQPGVSIGTHCVIGANSVVTRSIPAYSIAVGSPAKVVKRWDASDRTWKAVDPDRRT